MTVGYQLFCRSSAKPYAPIESNGMKSSSVRCVTIRVAPFARSRHTAFHPVAPGVSDWGSRRTSADSAGAPTSSRAQFETPQAEVSSVTCVLCVRSGGPL